MDNHDPFGSKHGIKGSSLLAIVIPNEMRESLFLFRQVPDELARLLDQPRLRRVGCHIGNVDMTCSNFDEKEDIEGLQVNRFDREEITRQQGVLVVIEEGSPCRGRFSVGNRQDTVTAQNLTDFFMADPVAELFQFAHDAVIAPTILSGELEHQLDDLGIDKGATDFLRLMVEGPLAFDDFATPPLAKCVIHRETKLGVDPYTNTYAFALQFIEPSHYHSAAAAIAVIQSHLNT